MSCLTRRRPDDPTRSAAFRAALLAVALLASAGSAIPVAAATADPVDTMAKVARDLGLQTKLPTDEPPKEKDIPTSNLHWHIPGAEWVLYAALGIGALFVLFALRDTIPGLSRRTRAKPSGKARILPIDEAMVERMAEAGDDADALARSGRLAEAMHLLLLRSVTELRRRLDVTIADSLTSREMVTRLPLPETGRHAFSDLVDRVERVHFGNAIPVEADYGACRAAYEALVGAMRAPARPGAVAA